MQTRVTRSFRLIGLATCLLLGTPGCTGIHDDGALPSRAVRVATPPPVEPAPSAAAPSGTPMLLRIEDIGPRALKAADHRLELLAAAWTADYVPRIQGFVDYQYDVNDALQDDDAFEGGVQAQVRLFDGLARERHRDEVRAQRQTLASRRRDLERRIAIEVEEARLALEEQHNALAVAQRSVAQAEASLRVEDDLYRHDKSTAAAVLDSEFAAEGRCAQVVEDDEAGAPPRWRGPGPSEAAHNTTETSAWLGAPESDVVLHMT